jgi:hypothetical protein
MILGLNRTSLVALALEKKLYTEKELNEQILIDNNKVYKISKDTLFNALRKVLISEVKK